MKQRRALAVLKGRVHFYSKCGQSVGSAELPGHWSP